MIFASVPFLFYFLPVFLTAYLLLPAHSSARNTLLLAASIVFYAWGELENLWLLALSILFTYLIGLKVAGQKRWLAAGVTGHLALLGTFKYAGFALSVLADLGLNLPITAADTPSLPLGISFFTFHALSYLIDVYRHKAPPARRLRDLTLYIVLFPQLIAGPIVRFSTIRRQLTRRFVTRGRLQMGLELFCIGLMQKLLLADTLARAVDPIFAQSLDMWTTSVAWTGVGLYMLQMYMDFSGYSHMALGLALMLGFRFPRNFNFPFRAVSITDFWRRWHISLSRWLRDYLYIPLGGSRHGALRTSRNLMLVFILCGLWHGASWMFLIWGAQQGVLLVAERAGLARLLARLPILVQRAYTLCMLAFGFGLIRATDMTQARTVIAAMFGFGQPNAISSIERFYFPSLAAATLIASLSLLPLARLRLMIRLAHPRWALPRTLACLAALYVAGMVLAQNSHSPFLYFRF